MHQTRSEVIRSLPLTRKGTKYVARALRHNHHSMPLVVGIRDILGLARTSKEVKAMIHNKKIKINGKLAVNLNDPLCLFSILGTDKNYVLTILPTSRFSFEETKELDRKLKILSKNVVKGGKMQYSLHDGTNILSDKKYNVGDTLILNFDNKILKHLPLDKGKEVFVISGSNVGKIGKIDSIVDGNVKILFDKEEVVLGKAHVIVI